MSRSLNLKSLPACLALWVCLGLGLAAPVLGADITVPPNVAGDLDGTAAADTITINIGGTVGGSVNGQAGGDTITIAVGATVSGSVNGQAGGDTINNAGDVGTGANGGDINGGDGDDAITNSGTVNGGNALFGDINGGAGTNTITNTGTVDSTIIGTHNSADDSTDGGSTINNTNPADANYLIGNYNEGARTQGGSSQITNTGTVRVDVYGSYNEGDGSSGGSNNIKNTGDIGLDVMGSWNVAVGSSGGSNTIENNNTVMGTMYGSVNQSAGTSGGSNTITNTGMARGGIFGTYNIGAGASGGSNVINNSGWAMGIYGNYNEGAGSSGGSNTITSSDTVFVYIIGSFNNGNDSSGGSNTITNNGTVAGEIYGSINGGDAAATGTSGGSNTITNTGVVNGDIYGSYNNGAGATGGGNTITNSGTVGHTILGTWNIAADSSGGSNTITNSGSAGNLVGSSNDGVGSSGGSNTVTNSGTVTGSVYGSYNQGSGSSGGSNTITNTGTIEVSLFGSRNEGSSSSGGGNTIKNTGTVKGSLLGSSNTGSGSSGGGNTITNTGTVSRHIYGSANTGSGSSGGGNTITNAGTVNGSVYGSFNQGQNSSGGGNTITNHGTVNGSVYGSLDQGEGSSSTGNTITNTGTVTGSIYAGNGDDTVTIGSGSSVGGMVDGQAGSDNLRFEGAGGQNASQYTNFESISFGGTGNTTLYGTWHFPGATTIDSGTMTIAGSLTTSSVKNSGVLIVDGTLTAATVFNYGTMGGSGMIHGDITNYGVISPGNSIGTLSVGSTVTFQTGSILAVELDCSDSCDLLSVAGSVALNGAILSTELPKALYSNGHSWCVIGASDGVTGNFDSISGQPNSVVLSLKTVNVGNEINVQVVRQSYASFASNSGGVALGRGLDGLVPVAHGGLEEMLLAMDWTMTAAEISSALKALQPEMYTAFTAASLEAGGMFDRALARRLEELRQRRSLSLDAEKAAAGPVKLAAAQAAPLARTEEAGARGWSVWGRALGLWADQNAADGYLGRSQTSGGAVVGADGAVTPWLRLGLAAGASRSDLGWSTGGYGGDTQAMHTGLYAQAELGPVFVRGSASYTSLDSSASRSIVFSGISAQANGAFDGDLLGAALAVGYDWRLDSWLLEPLMGLEYQFLKEDGFSEGGAGYLNLDVDSREHQTWQSSLGIRATRLVKAGSWELLPRLGILWRHRLGDDQPSLSASFTGHGSAPFEVSGAELPGDAAVLEAGLTVSAHENVSFFLDYGMAYADDYLAQTLSAGLQVSF